jgi:hypothetical protein
MIFINRNRQSLGQFDEQDVADGLKNGKFFPEDLAWQEPMESWKPLSEFANLPEPSAGSGPEPAEASGSSGGFIPGPVVPAPVAVPVGTLDIGTCVEAGWICFKLHWVNLVLGALVMMALSTISQLPVQAAQYVFEAFQKSSKPETWILIVGGIVFFFFWVLAMVCSALLNGGFLYFLLNALRRMPQIPDIFAGFRNSVWLQVLLGTFVTTIFIIIGFIFLIIPGIYLAVAFYYAPLLIIDRKMSFWEAMQLSRRTVHAQWFPVFGLVILSGLMSLLGVFFCCVGMLATFPLGWLWLAQSYRQLFGDSSDDSAKI